MGAKIIYVEGGVWNVNLDFSKYVVSGFQTAQTKWTDWISSEEGIIN